MNIKTLIVALIFVSPKAFAGAWGVGSFENDSALDWVYEIEESEGSGVLLQTLRDVFLSDYIEADVCSSAIAASEVVAAIKSGKYNSLPESLASWSKANQGIYEPEMSKFAQKALELCLDKTKSELAQLWEESDLSEWKASVKELELKLE